jgi:hypothetical protein
MAKPSVFTIVSIPPDAPAPYVPDIRGEPTPPDTGGVRGGGDTGGGGIATPTPDTLADRARVREHQSSLYPPIIAFNIPETASDRGITKYFLEFTAPATERSREYTRTVVIQPLAFGAGAGSIRAESSRVTEILELVPYRHSLSTIVDDEGLARFEITDLVRLAGEHEISRTWVIKPLTANDAFNTEGIRLSYIVE